MFNDNPDVNWYREFDQLGVERVRNGAMGTGWEKSKRQAARRWLEKQDTKVWQERRKGLPDRVPLKLRLRQSRPLIYAGTAVLAMIVAARIFRFF